MAGRIFRDLCGCEPPETITEIDKAVARARPFSNLARMLKEHEERDARFARDMIRFINTK